MAVKAVARDLVHKTDAGGVRVDLRGADEARAAAEDIAAAVATHGHRAIGFSSSQWPRRASKMLVGWWWKAIFGPSWPVAPAASRPSSDAT